MHELDSWSDQINQELALLLAYPVTAETITTYADTVLAQLEQIIGKVLQTYYETQPDSSLTGKAAEDEAFQLFGLVAVDEILQQLTRYRELMRQVRQQIQTAQPSEVVITPPDEVLFLARSGQPKEEDTEVEVVTLVPRAEMLLYLLLTRCQVSLQEVTIIQGVVTKTMRRKWPYLRVDIPSLGRSVYLCDEQGNATYVFDQVVVQRVGLSLEELDVMTKNQRNEAVESYPHLGVRVGYSKRWNEEMVGHLLAPRLEGWELTKVVGEEEWAQWEDVWQDAQGNHWLRLKPLAAKLGILEETALNFLEKYPSLNQPKVRDRAYYFCYEDFAIYPAVHEFLQRPVAATTGEWAGFYIDGEAKHWGTKNTLAKRLGITNRTLHLIVVDGFSTLPIRFRHRPETAYCLEEVMANKKVQKLLEAVPTNGSGEWEGFVITPEHRHFASIGRLVQKLEVSYRLKVSHRLVERWIEENDLAAIKLNYEGRHTDGYCWEDIQALPVVQKTLEIQFAPPDWLNAFQIKQLLDINDKEFKQLLTELEATGSSEKKQYKGKNSKPTPHYSPQTVAELVQLFQTKRKLT